MAALFTIVKMWKQPKCPLTMNEEDVCVCVCVCVCVYIYMCYIYIYIYIYICTMDYYLAIIKDEIMPFAAIQLDLEIIKLSEVRQTKTNII